MSHLLAYKKLILLFTLLCFVGPLTSSEDENLAVRRIAACYQDQDFSLTKELIQQFQEEYSNSDFLDRLHLISGDIAQKEQQFEDALLIYSKIQTPSLLKQARLQILNCEYLLKNYNPLKEKAALLLKSNFPFTREEKHLLVFYYAEALLRSKDQAEEELAEAEIYFKELGETSLAPYAKIALAQIYTLKKKYEEASALYLECADLFPNRKEDLLYLAATIQSHYNPDIARQTFYDVRSLEGQKNSNATYNWMVLLFNTQDYQTLTESKDEILESIPPSKNSYAHFVLGKSHLALQQFGEAYAHFSFYLQDTDVLSDKNEAYFLSLLACYHLNDESEFRHLFDEYEELKPSLEFFPKIAYLNGKLLQKNKQFKQAESEFKKIINSPDLEIAENALFEYAFCLYEQNQLDEAHFYFDQFLNHYPNSHLKNQALYRLIQSTCMKMNSTPSEELKKQLLKDYGQALSSEGFFEPEVIPEISLKMGKLYYDLQRPLELRAHLSEYFKNYPDHPLNYQAHLLLASSYKGIKSELENYQTSLENALTLAPTNQEKGNLFLHLFHSHSKKAKEMQKADLDNQQEIQKAADSLYQAIDLQVKVPQDHLLWLSHFYFQKAESQIKNSLDPLQEDVDRAQSLFSSLQKDPESLSSSLLQQIQWNQIQILGWQKRNRVKIKKLEAFYPKIKTTDPLYAQSLLELAQTYQKIKNNRKAKALYETLLSPSMHSSPEITNLAKLHLARLLIDLSNPKELPHQAKIRQLFRDLQVNISLKQEPLHLEAALDAALFNALPDLINHNYSTLLKELKEVKELFSDQGNLCIQEYQEMRSYLPQKDQIYQNYMLLIEARISHLEAKIAHQEGQKKLFQEKKQLAYALFENFQKSAQAYSPYFLNQVQLELQSIDQEKFPKKVWIHYFEEAQ